MSQSWNINPATRDYVMVGGAPQETDSLQVPAYFRLKAKRTKWLYAPDNKWGSDFYKIKKRTNTSNLQLENVALAALEPLIDDGRSIQNTAQVIKQGINSAGMQISIEDVSGQIDVQTFPGLGA